ncbi:MAG: alpha/beta fold hydrolase [Hyphomicrobiales bacterium]
MNMDVKVDGLKTVAASGDAPFDAHKPTLVFIHGAGMDRTVWAMQARHPAFLAWNVAAVDLPGHGLSDGDALTSIEDMAEWVVRLLDAMGVSKATLIGHSMGALVALEAAARAPTRIERIALLGVTYPMHVAPGLLEVAKINDISAVRMIIGWAYAPGSGLGTGPAPGLRMTGAGHNLLANARPGVLHADLAACNVYSKGLDSAEKINIPTLIILGGRDRRARPKGAAALAAAIPGADLITLDRCGHMMMSEAPKEVVATLGTFLEG